MLRVVINAASMSISASYGIQTFPAAPCFRGAAERAAVAAGGLRRDGPSVHTRRGPANSYSDMCSKDINNK